MMDKDTHMLVEAYSNMKVLQDNASLQKQSKNNMMQDRAIDVIGWIRESARYDYEIANIISKEVADEIWDACEILESYVTEDWERYADRNL